MKMNLRQYKLFVFDVDGTVAERGTTALYPQVSPVLDILGVQFCYAVDFWKFCEREVLNG